MRLGAALLVLWHAPLTVAFVHPVQQLVGTRAGDVRGWCPPQMVATSPIPSTLTTQGMGSPVGEEYATSGNAGAETSQGLRVVELYDTTLRDGTQMEGISASVNDKLKISRELHNFGASPVLGCWAYNAIRPCHYMILPLHHSVHKRTSSDEQLRMVRSICLPVLTCTLLYVSYDKKTQVLNILYPTPEYPLLRILYYSCVLYLSTLINTPYNSSPHACIGKSKLSATLHNSPHVCPASMAYGWAPISLRRGHMLL